MVLAEIEQRTGRPTAELFDLIAGTSTGGVLALGLTKPGANGQPMHSAASLLDLYVKEGGTIFSRSVWHRLYSVGSAIQEKYPAAPLEAILDRYFGETRLSEALTEVLVTSYEIERRIPWFFKRHYARDKNGDWDFPMKLIARATSAAPTYFEPLRIEAEDRSDYYALIDGGIYANNPAMCAFAEARSRSDLFPGDDFLVVSLGTGEMTRRLPYDEAINWGLLQWARPILSIVFDGASGTVDYQLRQLLPPKNGAGRYYRFQVRLDEGNDDMDDASQTNLRVLRLLGEAVIRDNGAALGELCAQLA
jgi:patatin-like phospholipase/acyl hydrolase